MITQSPALIFDANGLRETQIILVRPAIGTLMRWPHEQHWSLYTLSKHRSLMGREWVEIKPENLPHQLRAEALLLGIPI